ncbi:MAG: hypothetical protein HY908_21550 [Myxococcales bacterium]|nr:hypothetical protein [Myxococcales bacterium]
MSDHVDAHQHPAPETHGGLELEAFACALAHAEHFPPSEGPEVRRRLAIDEGAWQEALVGWGLALARALAEPEAPVAAAFVATFTSVGERLQKEAPALADVQPLRPVARPVAVPAAPEPVPAHASPAIVWIPESATHGGAPLDPDTTAPEAPMIHSDPLPFRGAPSERFLAELAAPKSRPRPVSPPSDPTCAIPAILGDLDTTLPFGSKEASPHDEKLRATLTLEQYASFCAELLARPERAAEVRTRYGIADAIMHRRLERAWATHLARDAAAATRFAELLRRFGSWLRAQR